MASGREFEGLSGGGCVLGPAARPWLDLVNILRAQGFHEDGFALPQVAVMGDQSSGKSSVLEALSGVPFPRGAGLVTRCPTILDLEQAPPGENWTAAASIVRSGPGGGAGDEPRSIASPREVTAAILELTAVLTNERENFSKDYIRIRVRSPDLASDLTLIDLPGIVRTATNGQDASVVSRVDGLLSDFLGRERTVILAVLPATQDVATVDILERAHRADPTGERTIGVVTKVDLVLEGEEPPVLKLLRNELKPLRLGYVAVNARAVQLHLEACQGQGGSQGGSQGGEGKGGSMGAARSLLEAQRAEFAYFRSHEHYRELPPDLVGTRALGAQLSALLARRIQAALPHVKFELLERLASNGAARLELGGSQAPPRALGARVNLLVKAISEYCSLLRQAVSGDYRSPLLANEADLRLRHEADLAFRTLADEIRSAEPNFDAPGFDESLQREMRALRGRELPGLVNSSFFYSFMLSKQEEWRGPVASAKQRVKKRLLKVSLELAARAFPTKQLPKLTLEVQQQVGRLVEKGDRAVETRLQEAFAQEEDPFVSSDELAREISRMRAERFERALSHVLGLAEGPFKGAASLDLAFKEAAKKPKKEKADTGLFASFGAPSSAEEAGNDKGEGGVLWGKSAAGGGKEAQALGSGSGSGQHGPGAVGGSSAAFLLGRVEEEVALQLGEWYMANHGVSAVAQVQDMRTALAVYWRLSSKRLSENACMALESHLLAPLADAVEATLLGQVHAQAKDDALFQESQQVGLARADLERRRESLQRALAAIEALAPGLAPQNPSEAQANGKGKVSGSGKGDQGDEAESLVMDLFFTGKSGDNNGYIYWLGTDGKTRKFENPHAAKKLTVTSSGMESGDESVLVSRRRAEVGVRAPPNLPGVLGDRESGRESGQAAGFAWLCVDLGPGRALRPTHFTLCHGAGTRQPSLDLAPGAFTLEGKCRATGRWLDLGVAPGSTGLASPHGVGTFPADAKGQRFRSLRVKAADKAKPLPVCAIELYGSLFQSRARA